MRLSLGSLKMFRKYMLQANISYRIFASFTFPNNINIVLPFYNQIYQNSWFANIFQPKLYVANRIYSLSSLRGNDLRQVKILVAIRQTFVITRFVQSCCFFMLKWQQNVLLEFIKWLPLWVIPFLLDLVNEIFLKKSVL